MSNLFFSMVRQRGLGSFLPVLGIALLLLITGCGQQKIDSFKRWRPSPEAETLAGQYALLLAAPQWTIVRDDVGRYVKVNGTLACGEPGRVLEVTYNADGAIPEMVSYSLNGKTEKASTFPEFARRELLIRALTLNAK